MTQNQKTFFIALYGVILTLTLSLAGMLLLQYHYFKKEAQDLREVKEAYYQHVEMLKRSLNASISADEDLNGSTDLEKKKNNDDECLAVDFVQDSDSEFENSEFEMISKDEDDRLKHFKSTIRQLSRPAVFKTKKIPKKIVYKACQQKIKYQPQRDFIFCWPIDLKNFWLSSLFGPRKRPNGHVEFHHAVDMAACKGTPVKAAADGQVLIAEALSAYGNCIMIFHNSRYKTRYAHLHRIFVKSGQVVRQGEVIGSVGDTGLVRKSGKDASHLHFEIYQDGKRVNPLAFLFN